MIKQQQPTVRGTAQKVEAISNKMRAILEGVGTTSQKQITKNITDRKRKTEVCFRCSKTGHGQQHQD